MNGRVVICLYVMSCFANKSVEFTRIPQGPGPHTMSAQNKSRYTVGEADPGGYVWLKSPRDGAAGGGEKRLVGTGWLPSCTAAPMGKTGRSGGLWPVTSHTAAQPSSCQAQRRERGPSLYSP